MAAVLALTAACHTPAAEAMTAGANQAAGSATPHVPSRSRVEQSSDRPLTRQQRIDIDWLHSILINQTSEPGIRSGAAVRLLNMQLPQATAVLVDGLRNNDPAVMAAVIEAMQQAPEPVEGLRDTAIAALTTAPVSLLDQLAAALARYDGAALEQIAIMARDTNAPLKDRMGPIHALGAFRTKSAAVELMSLLDEHREEKDEVIQAACASLQRGTGLPYGNDADLWREWWLHAQDQPRDEWMSQIIRRLSEQLAATEQQVQREREMSRSTEQRLAELYRHHFAALPSLDEQLALLPALLEDPLVSVRGFALDRIARLLRDSVRIGEDLQQRIALRLDDEVPVLRTQALRLLDQLNYEHTSRLTADRLNREKSPEVIAACLDVLIRRPSPSAIESVEGLLDSALYGERAANVIWEALIADIELPTERIETIRERLRASLDAQPRAAYARLLARMGSDEDVTELVRLLDGDDEVMRRRVAEGLYRRGYAQPLVQRAPDAIIYPFAVRALASEPIDLTTFRTLVLLTPNEQHRRQWYEAVEQAIGQLAPEQLLQADDVLASVPGNEAGLRIAALRRGADLPPGDISPHERERIVLRLARLLLDVQQPAAAHELLASLNGEQESAGARLIRFEAAALAGEYDAAALLSPTPQQWLELLYRIESSDPDAAIALHDEIIRRFHAELAEEHEIELEAVQRRLQSSNAVTQSPT